MDRRKFLKLGIGAGILARLPKLKFPASIDPQMGGIVKSAPSALVFGHAGVIEASMRGVSSVGDQVYIDINGYATLEDTGHPIGHVISHDSEVAQIQISRW